MMILAPKTAKITPISPYSDGNTPWIKVVKWFLFNWIKWKCGYQTIYDTIKIKNIVYDTTLVRIPTYYTVKKVITVYDTIKHHIDYITDTEYNIIDTNIYDDNLYFILGD